MEAASHAEVELLDGKMGLERGRKIGDWYGEFFIHIYAPHVRERILCDNRVKSEYYFLFWVGVCIFL